MYDNFGVDQLVGSSSDGLGLSVPVLFAILLLVIAIGILSSRVVRARTLLVKHLFLKAILKGSDKVHTVYIRALDLTGAIIVSSFAPEKGSVFELDLASLPKFPDAQDSLIRAKVKHVKGLGAQPSNYLIQLKFDKESEASRKEKLGLYLKQLHM